MANNFSQKEMLIRVLNKLEKIECKLNNTHEQAVATNTKVKLHTKIIFGMCGVIITLGGWFVSSLVK